MEIRHITLDTCAEATGIVVSIDVLRAFSTASYAFTAGCRSITLVSTVEEAFAMKEQIPEALIMGEVDGLPVKGFDYGNSPSEFIGSDLSGRQMIQRSSAGTQGVVHSLRADKLLAGSFCCAGATARYIKQFSPTTVTFVITGIYPDGRGDEDAACAEYIGALLHGKKPDGTLYVQRVRESLAARKFIDPSSPEFPDSDIDYCTKIDNVDFAMVVKRLNGRFHMEAVGGALR